MPKYHVQIGQPGAVKNKPEIYHDAYALILLRKNDDGTRSFAQPGTYDGLEWQVYDDGNGETQTLVSALASSTPEEWAALLDGLDAG